MVLTPPTIADVERIAALDQPVIRNLQITQCYCEISAPFAKRTSAANWCTFATWASKQAGETIRHEDLRRHLEARLKIEPEVEQALSAIATLLQQAGALNAFEQIKHSVLFKAVEIASLKASDAVSRGNKKVFEEIAREFARFMEKCFDDTNFTQEHIESFCKDLRPGNPPDGQEYLSKAFTNYYRAFFETDAKKQAEWCLLANLQIGFHEQVRLQPEIAEALNAVFVDAQEVKNHLYKILSENTGFLNRLWLFFKRIFGRTVLLDKAVDTLVNGVQKHLRIPLTAQMMTLTIPPNKILQLGHDLAASFPDQLKVLSNADLLFLLAQIDPTPDSLQQRGATDWANLNERLHFIADLFRCYHETKELFNEAFTPEQVKLLKLGKLPEGRL